MCQRFPRYRWSIIDKCKLGIERQRAQKVHHWDAQQQKAKNINRKQGGWDCQFWIHKVLHWGNQLELCKSALKWYQCGQAQSRKVQ